MKSNFFMILAFLVATALPQIVKANTTDINECLSAMKTHWLNKSAAQLFKGQTRTETECNVSMELTDTSLSVQAAGSPHVVAFILKETDEQSSRTLQTCKVDKEKIHFVFEEKSINDSEKRERVQMTLLRRHGNGLSMILNKRENKVFRPLQQTSLICHLN